ncbi:MAG: pyridoxal phosphate-dependent aminotransferase [Candidatus Bathyarchaeota archaeon]|nr:MAG: pyridoxal phosphate-dependent aminotransferase [Candidatus Bathyarchaeota archaeon]
MLYEINEKALKLESQGKKIIKLNIGDPDLATPTEIIEAAYDAMKRGKTKYSSAYGEKSLREKLSNVHNVYADNVIITLGAKWGVFSTMYLLLKDGGNVVIPSPYWTAYGLIAKNLGAEIKLVKTELDSNWKIDLETLESLIDRDTRMIILNNPRNPTSSIIDEKVLDGIVRIANDKGITILSDEVYADISFVKTKRILEYGGDHILVTGFSKTFTMTGWRIGYVIANTGLVEKLAKLNQITLTNVPVFIQEAALKALELQSELTGEIKREYYERAKLACDILSKTSLKFSRPSAPFYIFPKCRGLDSEKFALSLLDDGVAVAPGTSFGDYREHFRISLTAPRNDLKKALNKICEATLE